jgi:hypothetical protein
MQVFIIGTPLETASALSKRYLNNQINEAKIILDALNGAKAWSNHPCVLQYRGYEFWLKCYLSCLCYVKWGEWEEAKDTSQLADNNRPEWHTQEYFDQMKRRLYEKDEEYYKQWGYLGKSYENWYLVDGEWRIYENGKRIK